MPDSTLDAAAPVLPNVPSEVLEDASFLRKYRLEREIGVGGSGVVVCARHRELDERVAIKFLLSGSRDPDAMARFRREARAANRVKDEHVVRITDVATTESGVLYVVMEFLDGADLEQMLHETPDHQLPVRDAVEFVLQACEALAECHAAGIVHRDLKPSNLFCTHGADGLPVIKVLDFGISKLEKATLDGAMTGKNALLGSPRYMSPEQFSAPADVDHRADIWALGVIMYELLTGHAPFTGTTLISIWERVKTDRPRPLHELRRDAPAGLAPVVARCLEKDPQRRFPNVAELAKTMLPFAPERSRGSVARIVRILEAPGTTTASLSLPPSALSPVGAGTSVSVRSRSPQPRGRLVVGAALSLLVAVVASALALRNGFQVQRPPAPSVASQRAVTLAASVPPAPALRREVEHASPVPAPAREPSRPTLAAASSARARSSAHRPNAASSSRESVSAVPSASASPWIVDIVEQRRAVSAGEP